MAWHAKPYGSYATDSSEAQDNMSEMNELFTGYGYTLEAICGIIGNVIGESGLNPWRWQNDTFNLNAGYGLFQYTPASGYIEGGSGASGYGPNLDDTEETVGAKATDGQAQCIVFHENTLGKWVNTCWRDYWSVDEYYDLYTRRQHILDTYGNGSTLSMSQFMTIDNMYDATLAFLACFEGPLIPSMGLRYEYAGIAYEYLTGEAPPPTPDPLSRKMPIWFMTRLL